MTDRLIGRAEMAEQASRMHCKCQVVELFKACDKYDVVGLLRECIHVFHKITKARHVAYLLMVPPPGPTAFRKIIV
jgi:hypothetical protein